MGLNERIALSEHFYLHEFLRSDLAMRKRIPNTPTLQHIENMKSLCVNVLEAIRDQFGAPIHITSGFRSKALNKAVGGSSTSDHVLGRAVDFTVDGHTVNDVFEWIAGSTLIFDQALHEYGEWVHMSYRNGAPNRRQVLYVVKTLVRSFPLKKYRTEYLTPEQYASRMKGR